MLALAGILAVIVAGVLLQRVGGVPVGPDAVWQSLMATNRWPAALLVAEVLAFVGSSLGAAIVTVLVAVIALARRRTRTAIALLVAVGLGALASTSIKLLSQRPRPIGGVANLSTFSFPSGHTTWAAAVAITLALALPRVWCWISAAAWIALMAWSRTYLGVHWLTDVVAGAVLGASVALLATSTLAFLKERFLGTRHRRS